MKSHCLIPLLAATALSPMVCVAADQTAEQSSQRELLQPQKMSIASPITDRFALRAVYFRNSLDTGLRYDGSAGAPGTTFNAEDTLGLKDRLDQGSLDLMFRIGDRHRINADFSKQTRSGDTVLAEDLQFGDETYAAGERVLGKMDLRKLGIVYTYSLLRRERVEIALGAGLHLLQLEGVLEAPATFQRESLDTAGPFATLVADVSWRITRRFSVNAAAQYLDASVDDVEGGYESWHADLQFRAHRNLAVGAGYTQARYRVEGANPQDFAGYFSLKLKGPEIFLRASF